MFGTGEFLLIISAPAHSSPVASAHFVHCHFARSANVCANLFSKSARLSSRGRSKKRSLAYSARRPAPADRCCLCVEPFPPYRTFFRQKILDHFFAFNLSTLCRQLFPLRPIAPDASKLRGTFDEAALARALFLLACIRHVIADHVSSQFGRAFGTLLSR
jgi:hypothetical protein